MPKIIPVLGGAGFASDLAVKADQAISNFYITLRSQSDLYRGSVTSLSDIIANYGSNRLRLRDEVKQSLGLYLERQFDDVDLVVNAEETTDGGIELQISLILRDGDRYVDIQHLVSSKDSRIRSIVDLQNEGRPIDLHVRY